MSAKLLYTLTDEKADLHKQIGCLNGFFQIFDRHHFLTGRRVKGHKMLPPPIPDQNGNQQNSASEQSNETSVKKVTKEKQRVSTESSRTSFSSSSCSSSSSSLESNRITQPEPPSCGQNNQSKPQPLDLQELVKNSVRREARALEVKTVTKEEAQGHIFKHIDSPRPLQQPKSVKQRDSGLSQSYQAPGNSKEEKDRSRLLATRYGSRDAPRFSFDGRESRDTFKSLKIKELPRLSLDSKERTMRALQMENRSSNKIPTEQQEMGSYNRPSSVVAKLMGLEAFPADTETIKSQTRLIKTTPEREVESLSRSSRSLGESKQNHMLGSPRSSYRDSTSPRMRNADSATKSTSSSKFPKELPGLKHQEADTKSSCSSSSVYGEIEKRLADIEFRKSGKDLRALKRILEAMQKSKEMSETRKESQASNPAYIEQSSKLQNQRSLQNSSSAITRGSTSPKSSRSSIVIMKPAKLTDRANSTAILMTSDDQKSQTSSCSLHSIDINTRTRSPRAVSSRLQQKKNGPEKEPCATIPSSDSNRNRRQLSRQLRPKSPNSKQGNNQSKKTSSSMRDLRNHGDANSQQSESSTSSTSHIETDTTSTNGSDKNNTMFFQHYGQKQKKLEVKFMADRIVTDSAVINSEQPSPISVLDATFYRDESPSRVKKIITPFKDDKALYSDEAEWISVGVNPQLHARTPNLSSKSYLNKSENIEHLDSIPTLDESMISYSKVLCEHSNPDHRYISKILLASGLLRDLDSGMATIRFHSSGHPINPNMFLAVEQTMASIGLSNDDHRRRHTANKYAVEKIQRKLIFDVVNEILGHKLLLESCSKQWFPPNKQARGKLKSQQLVAELFSEIDQLQTNKTGCVSDDEDDSLASISWGDMMHQSENWTYTSENAGLVLDIERLIFKDLISEVVNGETVDLLTRSGGCCRQLFSK